MLTSPIPYSPSVEQPTPDESATSKDLDATLHSILETTAADYGHAVRAVHAKSHGLIDATLTSLPDLPPEYAQGLFAQPGMHPAVLRFSAIPGDVLDDAIGLPNGLAIKILGVDGERMEGAAAGSTQDFILVNDPVFTAPNPAAFLKSLKLLAATTDRAEWAKKLLSKLLARPVEAALEAVGHPSGMLKTLGGAKNAHPLGETYFSQTAFRHGDYVAKLSVAPISPNLVVLCGETVKTSGDRDALRHAVQAAMVTGPAEWELRVQLCRDIEAMPVEDPTVEWEQEASPFVPVARIHAPAQPGWSDELSRRIDDDMRFSVWTGLEAHRPLGAVNRVRRNAYDMSAKFRGQVNGCPMHEPAG
ncbi:MAG: Catalase [Rubritepida sp.]|nr:Catalase [Rubritepida sp.]